MQISRKTYRLFFLSLLFGFLAAFLINYFNDVYLKSGYPFNTFLFRPESKFLDFYFPYSISANPYNQLVEYTSMGTSWQLPKIINGADWERNRLGPVYFPFAYWIAYPFHLLPFGLGLLTFWLVSILIFMPIGLKHLRPSAGLAQALIICLLSYPFLFLLNRSNFEIFIFLFVYLFFIWYDKHPWLSSGALACAIAMKFLPVGYLIIYLRDKKYKQAVLAGGLAFVLNVIAYAFYPGGLINNIRAHLFNLRISSLFYGLDGRDLAFNSSLASGVKYLYLLLWPRPDLEAASSQAMSMLHWLLPVVAVVVLMHCFFLERERWKQSALLTGLILLLPASSADYRLLLMYIPFFLWLEAPTKSRFENFYALLFAGLFIPKSYFHLPVSPEISISVLINPLLIIALIVVIISEKMREMSDNKIPLMDFWVGIPRWQKYGTAIFGSFVVVWSTLSPLSSTPIKDVPVSVVQQLENSGKIADKNKKYLDAIGYYGQWLVLEPANPEPRIGLANAYLGARRYLESFQQYQKAIWLSALGTESRAQAETGLQTSMQGTVCDMMKKQEFEWAHLIEAEYKEQFPGLPFPSQIDCAKFIE